MALSWFQVWTIAWQVSVILTPLLVGCAVLWLRSQFVTKTDAVTEKNRVDAAFSAARAEATTERNRVDTNLNAAKAERDARWDQVRDTMSDHAGRLKAVETDTAKPPSRHQLNNTIATLQATVHGLSRTIDSLRNTTESQNADIRREMGTLNGYLHTMIEKHLS